MQKNVSWSQRLVPPVLIALALSGCGTTKPPSSQLPTQAEAAQPAPASPRSTHPVLPPAGSGRGGYYLDDGPGDAPPDDLEALANARPRVERYSRYGNKSYVVFGKTYRPFTDDRPYKKRGRGSWYGKKFHGRKTSSGELYDMYQMTAAHPTLPIPSYARVTHVGNGRQVIVRVNDRGPFLHGRIIDLSYTAALKLGYIRHGSAELEVERLLPDEIARMNAEFDADQSGASALAIAITPPAVEITAASVPMEEPSMVASLAPVTTEMPAPARTTADSGYYLQAGAFSQQANAAAARAQIVQNWSAGLPLPELTQAGGLHRVTIGPFQTRDQADTAARFLEDGHRVKSVIVLR